MPPRQTLAAVAVALTFVLAAGCGGSSAPSLGEYEASVGSTRDRVDDALAFITQASSRENLLDRMEEAAGRIDRAADELDDAGAAKGFGDQTDRLVDALHQLATDLEGTAEQIREPGFEELVTGARGVSFESWTEANRVLEWLRSKGLDVQPLERH